MNGYRTRNAAAVVGVLVCIAGIGADAQERALYEDEARALAETVIDRSTKTIDAARGEDLAAWAESVIGRALDETGSVVGAGSVSVEAHAPAVARAAVGSSLSSSGLPSAGPEVIVFMSLAVPEPSWRQWSAEAARIGAPMVLRGVSAEGFTATVRATRARQSRDGAGAGIDPTLFRLFRIAHVPAVAVVPGGVAPCATPGCSADPPPPHDLVTGNIGLDAALEAIAREGGPGREAARASLARLRGESE